MIFDFDFKILLDLTKTTLAKTKIRLTTGSVCTLAAS